MAQTAALLKPAQKILEAIKDYTIKIDSEETTISDYPLKAALIYEAMQKWGVSAPVLAEELGISIDVANSYLSQRIDPSATVYFYGKPYKELDREKIKRQIKLIKKAAGIKFQGGMDDAWYTHDMATKLAIRGVSDLQQFVAKHEEFVLPANSIVSQTNDNQFISVLQYEDAAYEESQTKSYPIDSRKIKKITEFSDTSDGPILVDVYKTTEPITLDLGISYWYNKENGKEFPPLGDDIWETAFEGKGRVYYKVKLTDSGLPIFYTQWESTSDLGAILPVFSIVSLAFGLPLLLGETVLGAVGITATEAVSTAVGNLAINTALTGGDVTLAVTNAAASFAGGQIGGQIGETVDSVAIGKAATVATTAALKGKQIDALTLATALASDTGIKKMDETIDFFPPDDYVYDPMDLPTDITYSDFGDLSFEDIGVDTSIAVDLADSLDAGEFAIESADLVDDYGNVYDFDGDMTAMTTEAYLDSLYPDAEGIKDGYNNVVIPADQVVNMTGEEVAQEVQRYIAKQSNAEVSTGERTANTPAANPSVAKTAKMPSLPDSANAWDKLLKTAVSIGASVKAITSGTFRPTYQTSAYGTPRANVGVHVQRADGSIVTNNGNGTQTIRYANGQVQTVSTNYTGSGVLGGLGISTQTLLIGGAVLLGVALLARRK